MEKAKEYTSEEQQWLTENRLSRFQNRITPSWIRDMGENEIFVFGSNVNGYHGGGPHVNFETLKPNPNKPGKMMVDQNYHVFITE